MNIDKIRNNLELFKGKTLAFRFNGSRNQIEEFSGEIVSLFPYIFTIKEHDKEIIKSFSYSDVLIRKLVIINK